MTGFCDVPAESQAKKIPTQRSSDLPPELDTTVS